MVFNEHTELFQIIFFGTLNYFFVRSLATMLMVNKKSLKVTDCTEIDIVLYRNRQASVPIWLVPKSTCTEMHINCTDMDVPKWFCTEHVVIRYKIHIQSYNTIMLQHKRIPTLVHTSSSIY